MSQLFGNCLIGQSGGPTSAINSSLSGVIEQAYKSKHIDKIYGAVNGIEGVLKKNIFDFSELLEENNSLQLLKNTPAAFLGSCRYKLPLAEHDAMVYKQIFDFFKEYHIRYFFYIGGNDSMDTVMKLSNYANKISFPIQIIGIPKTIDNDLTGTDHCPGFGSAAKFIATSVLEITHDSEVYDVNSVTIIEIMGRNAGWLTAASALARNEYNTSPDLIYLPEVSFSTHQFIEDIKRIHAHKKNVMVTVSEGIKDEHGKYICEMGNGSLKDNFGHTYLGGTGKVLESLIRNTLSCKARSIELSVLQRCASHIASGTDLDEAFEIGRQAVITAEDGNTGKMMIFKRMPGKPYKIAIDNMDINQIANIENKVPLSWISKEGNDIQPELIEYLQPLIIGEPQLEMQNGLPAYLTLKAM